MLNEWFGLVSSAPSIHPPIHPFIHPNVYLCLSICLCVGYIVYVCKHAWIFVELIVIDSQALPECGCVNIWMYMSMHIWLNKASFFPFLSSLVHKELTSLARETSADSPEKGAPAIKLFIWSQLFYFEVLNARDWSFWPLRNSGRSAVTAK